MKREKITIALMVILMSFSLLSCGEKEDPATPVTPVVTVPDYVGSWTCIPSNAQEAISFTIVNIDGKAKVNSYEMSFVGQGPTGTNFINPNGTYDTMNMVEVVSGAFTLTGDMIEEVMPNSVLTCQFSTESAGSGTYTIIIPSSQNDTVTGTFTTTLNQN